MADDERIEELLDRWETAFDQRNELSAEELCKDCPHLIDRVLEEIRSLRATAWLKTRLTRNAPGYPRRADLGLNPVSRWAGVILADRYRLVERIGEGGSGEVWRSLDMALGREVAVKLPIWLPPATSEKLDPFLEEARRVAQLDHPGIVPVYDVGMAEGSYYIVSKLLVGSLADLTVGRRLPPEAAVGIVRRLAQAVAFAHDHGFVHCDLKPSNVLFDGAGAVYLADFGIATAPRLTEPREEGNRGTLAYMAPEQLRSWANYLGSFTDVWALGVILFELLTGRLPFTGQSETELQRRILSEEAPDPLALIPDLPADLVRCCLRCLKKDGHGRFPSVTALEKALEQITLTDGIEAGRHRFFGVLGSFFGGLRRWTAGPRSEERTSHSVRRWTLDALAGRPSPTASPAPVYIMEQEAFLLMGQLEAAVERKTAAVLLGPPAGSTGGGDVSATSELRAIGEPTGILTRTPLEAAGYLSRGMVHLLTGDTGRAVEDFGQAIRLAPNDAGGYFQRGRALLLAGDELGAIRDFGGTLRLDPIHSRAVMMRGIAHLRRAEIGSAVPDLDEAIRLSPDNPAGFYHRGRTWLVKADFDRAEADFSAAIDRGLDVPAVFLYRGVASQGRKNYLQALVDFNETIRLAPQYAHGYLYRGQVHCDLANFDQAVADLTVAAGAGLDRAVGCLTNVHLRRGLAFLEQTTFHLSIPWTSGSRWYGRDPAVAIASFDKAIQLSPNDPAGYYYRGRALLAKAAFDRAEADFSAAIERDAACPAYYLERGFVFLVRSNYSRAEADFDEANRLDPSYGKIIADRICPGDRFLLFNRKLFRIVERFSPLIDSSS